MRSGVCLVLALASAACSVARDDEVGSTEHASTERCNVTLTMAAGSASDPSRWSEGRDDWGEPATHHAALGREGAGYAIDVREGNAYATLTLSEGRELRPGTYELAINVKTSRLDGSGCADPAAHWVEV